jgi:DNA processing protein
MREELLYKIAITLIPGIGDVLGKKLVAYCGGVEPVFRQKKAALLKIPGIGKIFADAVYKQDVLKQAEAEIIFMEQEGIRPVFYLDEAYPRRLKHCADSPLMLYYKGTEDLNPERVLGIVGTRNATGYGKELCTSLVEGLASRNVLVVSGLAYGIDICAHKACVKNDIPTIAVLAHGLDAVYPPLHRSVTEKMLINGGLLSDYPSKTNPDKENFPRRNRIVAGMCDAVVVIESAVDGGSMITAEIANSYNRDVFAFPGRTDDPYSAGCHKLIKQNKAALAESAEDILRMLSWQDTEKKKPVQRQLFVELTAEEEIVVGTMKDKGNVHIDEICILAAMPMRKVSSLLLNMEFAGVLKSLPGKMYRLNG